MHRVLTIAFVATAIKNLGTNGFQFGSSPPASATLYNLVSSSYLSRCPGPAATDDSQAPLTASLQPQYLPAPLPFYSARALPAPYQGVSTPTQYAVYPPGGVQQICPPGNAPPQQAIPSYTFSQIIESPPQSQLIQNPPPQTQYIGSSQGEIIQNYPTSNYISPPSTDIQASQVMQTQQSPVAFYPTFSEPRRIEPFETHIMSISRKPEPSSLTIATTSSNPTADTMLSASPAPPSPAPLTTPFLYTPKPLIASCPATVFFPTTPAVGFSGQFPTAILSAPQIFPAPQPSAFFSSGPADLAFTTTQTSGSSVAAIPAASSVSSSASFSSEPVVTANAQSTTTNGFTSSTGSKDVFLKTNSKDFFPTSSLDAENKDCSMPTPPVTM